MDTREITLAIPEDLYLEGKEAGVLNENYFRDIPRGALRCVTWEERISEIQREIAEAGVQKKSKEEVIAELRAARKHLWETLYRGRYLGSVQ